MGVERAVVRWYAQRQLLVDALRALDEKLTPQSEHVLSTEESSQLKAQYRETQERLRLLGPCPMPKMG